MATESSDVGTFDTSSLSIHAKLALVERLWDEIGDEQTPLPLPARVDQLATQRLAEMRDHPEANLTHKEVWRRIENRNG